MAAAEITKADISTLKRAGILLSKDGIIRARLDFGSIAGCTAHVETEGELQRRVTATRLLTIGVFAFAAKKKKDERALYLTVEGPEVSFVIDVKPKDSQQARMAAATINRLGQSFAPAADPASVPPPPPPSAPAGWMADPHGRHELRYWDGTTWTGHVSDQGVQSSD